jgi:molecular chaperone DnaK (HSP70)
MSDAKYIVGIDLGTTNSILAYTAAESDVQEPPAIQTLEIPQLVSSGAVGAQDMLPSFIYLPDENEISSGAMDLPWQDGVQQVVGELARNRGTELPQRLISSSKSWLCNTMVDRNQAILPWGSPAEIPNLSPVEASAAILNHIRRAWNHTIAADDENLMLERQEIYLTVPASFDAVARELTVKAAGLAGMSDIILLEEPQAAFYAWIQASGDHWREAVRPGDLVLVCDIGGGTTDFSLIRVSESAGSLELERIAVGNHILVGGDNMDLALAYAVAKQMTASGQKLDSWQMRALWHGCRNAKEKIVESSGSAAIPISVLGRGSGLIGGTLRTELTRDIVEQVLVEGFFPLCGSEARPEAVPRTGIRETGLAYEADPAVTRHLANFLSQSGDSSMELPTAVLFNGGVMKAGLLQERVQEVLSSWHTDSTSLRVLKSSNPDLAVATGAAYYGLARRGRGVRIRSGLNKSYYIGIAASLPAVPGMPTPIKALCVAPFGMEEGTTTEPTEREFNLIVGEPAKFDFLSSVVRTGDEVGILIDDWEEEIESITTIETTLDGNYGTVIPVSIQIKLTEIGTLEIWCVSRQDSSRRKLEFSLREKV